MFRDRVGYSPLSAVTSAFGAMGALFLLGRLQAALDRAGWSLRNGKGRVLVWLLFGCSAALELLGGYVSRANRWAFAAARPLLRWQVVVGASVRFAVVIGVRGATWDPLDPLRALVAAAPVDDAYALAPSTWAGHAAPQGGSPAAVLLGGMLAAFGMDDMPMVLAIQGVSGDSWGDG